MCAKMTNFLHKKSHATYRDSALPSRPSGRRREKPENTTEDRVRAHGPRGAMEGTPQRLGWRHRALVGLWSAHHGGQGGGTRSSWGYGGYTAQLPGPPHRHTRSSTSTKGVAAHMGTRLPGVMDAKSHKHLRSLSGDRLAEGTTSQGEILSRCQE